MTNKEILQKHFSKHAHFYHSNIRTRLAAELGVTPVTVRNWQLEDTPIKDGFMLSINQFFKDYK